MADELPERRQTPTSVTVTEFRLGEVEKALGKQDTKLEVMSTRLESRWDQIDSKIDQLRRDLFENHPFVPTNVFSSEVTAIKGRLASLERMNENANSGTWTKLGIVAAFVVALVTPFITEAIRK